MDGLLELFNEKKDNLRVFALNFENEIELKQNKFVAKESINDAYNFFKLYIYFHNVCLRGFPSAIILKNIEESIELGKFTEEEKDAYKKIGDELLSRYYQVANAFKKYGGKIIPDIDSINGNYNNLPRVSTFFERFDYDFSERYQTIISYVQSIDTTINDKLLNESRGIKEIEDYIKQKKLEEEELEEEDDDDEDDEEFDEELFDLHERADELLYSGWEAVYLNELDNINTKLVLSNLNESLRIYKELEQYEEYIDRSKECIYLINKINQEANKNKDFNEINQEANKNKGFDEINQGTKKKKGLFSFLRNK